MYQRLGYRTRGVIMAELLADPGFDLIYRRTGSVFIPRDNGPQARELLHHLQHGIDAATAVVIFPEGRLFRPELLTRFLSKLTDTNPDRAQRLSGLRHVLPPRPGGGLALLDAIPHADVVVIAHAGLDRFGTFTELSRAVPLHDAIQVTAWRIPATDIPPEASDRVAWLDEQWIRLDQWVHERANNATRLP
jgi:1-acyl-sn-glycerol-3-phosphate acyltransferase